MGYYNAVRSRVLLRAGRRVHDLRPLPQLGDRPDRPQPPLRDERVARPRRRLGRAASSRRSTHAARALRQPLVDDDARAARGRAASAGRCTRRRTATSPTTCCRYFKQYQSNPKLLAKALVPSFPRDLRARLPARHAAEGLVGARAPPPQRASADPGRVGSVRLGAGPQGAHRQPGALGEDRPLHHLRRERRLLRPRRRRRSRRPGRRANTSRVGALPSEAGGVRGPIGLGFRVPMLIASPFARGGLVCSDTFDHTSTLRFLEARFGAEVPNLSAWRRSVTGDLDERVQLRDRRPVGPGSPPPEPGRPSRARGAPAWSARRPAWSAPSTRRSARSSAACCRTTTRSRRMAASLPRSPARRPRRADRWAAVPARRGAGRRAALGHSLAGRRVDASDLNAHQGSGVNGYRTTAAAVTSPTQQATSRRWRRFRATRSATSR